MISDREFNRIETLSRQLDLDPKEREKLSAEIYRYLDHFLDSLSSQPVFRPVDEIPILEHTHIADADGQSIEDIMQTLNNTIIQPGINAASGGHMGYIPGGGLFPAALGDYIAAITNRYSGIYYAAPGAVVLENRLIDWMKEIMGFPDTATGTLTSGGSVSILIAVVAARDASKISAHDYEKCVVYHTEQTHHALHKALRIAGLGSCKMSVIPMDNALRMNLTELEEQIELDKQSGYIPFMINASVGTTNTGAVDPIMEIGKIAKAHEVWYHIDAAYGGFFKLVERCGPKLEGMELADSLVLDPHKSLFLPFGTGAVLIKDTESVLESHHYLASYMQDMQVPNREISPADVSPELTRHFRGLRLWLPLQYFGLEKITAALDEKLYLAQYFYEEVQKIQHIETGPEPDLTINMFRIQKGDLERDNALNQKLLHAIQIDGRIFLSSTTIDGVFWIRVCILSFRTHKEHVEMLLQIIKAKMDSIIR